MTLLIKRAVNLIATIGQLSSHNNGRENQTSKFFKRKFNIYGGKNCLLRRVFRYCKSILRKLKQQFLCDNNPR